LKFNALNVYGTAAQRGQWPPNSWSL